MTISIPPAQHVVPHDSGWAIRKAGASKVSQTFDRQSDAITKARDVSRNQSSELVIHGRDGRIIRRDSHGHDPFPPKG